MEKISKLFSLILYEGFEEVYKKEKTKNMNTHNNFSNITIANHRSL